MKRNSRSLAFLPLIFLFGLSLAGCSSSAATPAGAQFAPTNGTGGKDIGAVPAASAAPAAGNTAAPLIGPQSLIIKTGQLNMQVSKPDASAAQANGIVGAAGGYVSASARSGA